jgi:hypothetical protein
MAGNLAKAVERKVQHKAFSSVSSSHLCQALPIKRQCCLYEHSYNEIGRQFAGTAV